MKRLLILFLVLVMTSCSDDSETDVERISGFYEATTFMEPGELDSGVDILDNGGILTARLTSNFDVDGRLFIPENIGSSYPPTDENYNGEFSLDGDTVRFKNTSTFLDYDPWMFIVKGARLETPDWTGRWASTKIILDKQ